MKSLVLSLIVGVISISAVYSYRHLLENSAQVASQNDDGLWSSSPITVPPKDCGYFILEPGLKFGYRAYIDSIEANGCDKVRVSKLYMDQSCTSSRDGTAGNGQIKIFGKTIDVDTTDSTLYPCIEEINNEGDIIKYDEKDPMSLQKSCFDIENDSTALIGLEELQSFVQSGKEFDSGEICAVLNKSDYAIIFINNRQCETEVVANIKVHQESYNGKICPSESLAIGIIVGIGVAAFVIVACLVSCIVKCLCCK